MLRTILSMHCWQIARRPSTTPQKHDRPRNTIRISRWRDFIMTSYWKVITFLCLLFVVKTTGLVCMKCDNAKSHRECDFRGAVEYCRGNDNVCKTEVRVGSNPSVETISKGCKQRLACMNNAKRKSCDTKTPNTLCYCCCNGDRCNRGDRSCSNGGQRPQADAPRRCPSLLSAVGKRYTSCSRGTSPGSVCRVKCYRGYKINTESAVLKCLNSGRWSGVIPTCQRTKCFPSHQFLTFGRVMCTNRNVYGSLCRFKCNDGYKMQGKHYTRCWFNRNNPSRGQWTDQKPKCQMLAAVAYLCCTQGILSVNKCIVTWTTKITYVGCGNSSSSNFSAVIFTFLLYFTKPIPPQCPRIPVPNQGSVKCSSSNTIVGSSCLISCEEGHKLEGTSSVKCIRRSSAPPSWDPPHQAKCIKLETSKKRCPPIKGTPYAITKCDLGEDKGSKCTFSCQPHYDLIGSSVITCLERPYGDVEWEPQIPQCKVSTCPALEKIDHGTITCDHDGFINSKCTFKCHSNYYMIGQDEVTCLEKSDTAVWSGNVPKCKGRCPTLEPPKNGFMECMSGSDVGSTCSFNCGDDFALIGQYEITCLEIEEVMWSNKVPTCQKTCNAIGQFTNGDVTCSNEHLLTSKCEFVCNEGYKLIGSPVMTCVESDDGNTLWDREVPKCEKMCPSLPLHDHVTVSCTTGIKIGSVCQFLCDEFYETDDSLETSCVESGTGAIVWDNVVPRCTRQCPPLPELTLDWAQCSDGWNLNSECSFTCPEHHFLKSGSPMIKCVEDENGTPVWNGKFPQCEIKTCPELSPIGNGSISCPNGFTVNSVCEFTCEFPFRLFPARTSITCQPNKKWNHEPPCCATACSKNPKIDLLFVLDSSSSVGINNWKKMIHFVQTVVGQYNVTRDGANVGILRFNEQVDTENVIPFFFGVQKGKKALLEQIGSIPYSGHGTKTGRALRYAAETCFTEEFGDRPEAQNVMIVLTDGRSTDKVKVESELLREHGVWTYAVGVKSSRTKLHQGQLKFIGGHDNNVYIIKEGYDALTDDFARQLVGTVCKDPCHK